jgi:hypothetical protein
VITIICAYDHVVLEIDFLSPPPPLHFLANVSNSHKDVGLTSRLLLFLMYAACSWRVRFVKGTNWNVNERTKKDNR